MWCKYAPCRFRIGGGTVSTGEIATPLTFVHPLYAALVDSMDVCGCYGIAR
jgi:hypothetical protein